MFFLNKYIYYLRRNERKHIICNLSFINEKNI